MNAKSFLIFDDRNQDFHIKYELSFEEVEGAHIYRLVDITLIILVRTLQSMRLHPKSFIKEKIEDMNICILFVRSREHVADDLTYYGTDLFDKFYLQEIDLWLIDLNRIGGFTNRPFGTTNSLF